MITFCTRLVALLILALSLAACKDDSDSREEGLEHIDRHVDHLGEQFEKSDGVPTNKQGARLPYHAPYSHSSLPPGKGLLPV